MATTIWKGHLTFGLISVPIKLYAAARSEGVSFNQLHAPCKSRIKQQIYCPVHETVVERRDLVKGYEVESGRWVIIEDADLEKILPPSSKTLEVLEFVKLAEVDPVYFNTSYYLVPDIAGEKAYYLLVEAMRKTGHVGIAKMTMHQREHVVIVRPAMDGLMLHTIYYADEVRTVDEYGDKSKVALNEKELDMAELFINTLASTFDAEKYRDSYRDNVLSMIRAKAEGAEVQAAPTAAAPPVVDLMAALKIMIEQKKGETAEAAPVAATAPAVPTPRGNGRKKGPARVEAEATPTPNASSQQASA
jgi:DNA end-binding protein Ku